MRPAARSSGWAADSRARRRALPARVRIVRVVGRQSFADRSIALGGGKGGRRGRPPRPMALTLSGMPRKKAPRQLCPVPGCKNAAAPVFGMVCSKHKDVLKAKIKKYREARRAKKLKGN